MIFGTFEKEEKHPLDLKASFLAMVNNSVGTEMFRNLYRETPDGPDDVINDGDLACAFSISALLSMFGLIKGGIHTTVIETEYDLNHSGWKVSDTPVPGAVVVWGEKMGDDGRTHRHIGICVDDTFALNNVASKKSLQLSDINSLQDHNGNTRPVLYFYKHPLLA